MSANGMRQFLGALVAAGPLVYVSGSLFDIVTTTIALNQPGFSEGMPTVAWLMGHFGIVGGLVVAKAGAFAIIWGLAFLDGDTPDERHRTFYQGLALTGILYFAISGWNATLFTIAG